MPSLDDPRVYFAAERTLLAWIRTGITIIGLGFVVAKFGLFLRFIRTLTAPDLPRGWSPLFPLWITSTLALGGLLLIGFLVV